MAFRDRLQTRGRAAGRWAARFALVMLTAGGCASADRAGGAAGSTASAGSVGSVPARSAGPGGAAESSEPARIMDIAPAWAATRVNAGIYRHHVILSAGGRQFVTFYDPDARLTIAWRDLPAQTWTIHRTEWTGNVRDAHNVIVMGISRDNILHMAYNHHSNPLNYRRTAKPLDAATFGPLIPMTGKREDRVTYPAFVNLHDGTLLFLYRDGVSGNGDLLINRYDETKQAWEVVNHPVISGAGKCNPYWCRPAVGTDGSLQLAFCWRRTGNAETNHRMCYARSPDGGKTWQNSRGEPYTLPITPDTAEVIDPIPENSNLSNQDSSEVDSRNRLHVAYRKNDENRIPQYFHMWWDGSKWRRGQISQFTEAFTVKGPGAKRIPLGRPNLFFSKGDRIHVLYRDIRQGSRPMMATADAPDYANWRHQALADLDLLTWEPNYDLARWKREGVLDLFLLAADQGDHETVTQTGPQMVRVLEYRP